MSYTVKNVADISGISVRALHHYDEIGLFKPESTSESGYRHYSDNDLERLQEILFFRELEFSLKDIKSILSSPEYDRKKALTTHKEILIEKKLRIEQLITSVEKTINTIEGGQTMTKKEMFEVFDESKMEEYKKEAKARWPKTYAESEKKMANYTKDDYNKIAKDGEEARANIIAVMDKGAGSPEVQKLIADNYRYINDKFYTCTPEIFRNLGQMYVDDERFKSYYEKAKPGLAEFMRDAMKIYAEKLLET